MLIVFDLDDTLIDTSGVVTPFKMRRCLELFQKMGLALSDFSQSYEELMAINARSSRSVESLKLFLDRKGANPAWIAHILPELTSPLPSDFSIPTTPYAKEILKELSSRYPLALVTGGHPPFQREKLKKAGIEPSLFSNILIPEDSIKKPSYEALYKEFFLNRPRDMVVCGDRISMDLAPAHELGFTTVHMRWGRGLVHQTEPWVDFAISDLSELRKILQ